MSNLITANKNLRFTTSKATACAADLDQWCAKLKTRLHNVLHPSCLDGTKGVIASGAEAGTRSDGLGLKNGDEP